MMSSEGEPLIQTFSYAEKPNEHSWLTLMIYNNCDWRVDCEYEEHADFTIASRLLVEHIHPSDD